MNDEIKFLDLPIRLDATLCDPGEIWLEQPDGSVIRIYPPEDESRPQGCQR